MKAKNLLSITDLSAAEITNILEKAAKMKKGPRLNILAGKVLALVFEKPSLSYASELRVGDAATGRTGPVSFLRPRSDWEMREPVSDVTPRSQPFRERHCRTDILS